ncbi:MAG: type II toxin-antitoxin system RelB/DinJ family antitoxin [Candidatus Saccharimonadales bacterium]
MSDYAVINLKTDPALKKAVQKIADELGVSISAVLNNELHRFARERRVTFEIPEVPNAQTAKRMEKSRKEFQAGDYHKFETNDEALDFLHNQLS